MDIQYFKSAWGDIRNSRGWFGKLCLLALLGFIPIFGQIVAFAYIYGWAREIAWGTHEPMPPKIFSNEDGKFWRRGWFVFVLTFVFMLIPGILYTIGATLESTQYVMTWLGPQLVVDPVMQGVGALLRILGIVTMLIMGVFAWIGSMRVAIYDRLSAGFQFGKILKMLRRDMRGIMRVFGMELLVTLIIGFVLLVVFAVLMSLVIAAGLAGLVNSGISLQSWQYMTQAQQLQVVLYFIGSAGVVGVISALLFSFLVLVAHSFVDLLVVRAVGYWTMQFEVPIWGGQDDPMPFELIAQPESSYGYDEPPVASAPAQSSQPVKTAAPVESAEPVQEPAATVASQPGEALESPMVPPADTGTPIIPGESQVVLADEGDAPEAR